MKKNIIKKAYVEIVRGQQPTLFFEVKVHGEKSEYGRKRYLVSPESGIGKAWLEKITFGKPLVLSSKTVGPIIKKAVKLLKKNKV